MVSFIKSLYSIAIVACFANAAYAIHCNECESNLYSKCRDPFTQDSYFELNCELRDPPKFLQDLNPSGRLEATGCMKKTFKFNENSIVVQRSCYWGEKNLTTGCLDDPLRPYLKQLSCDVCETHMCNSSIISGPIAATITLFFVLIRMMS